MFILSVFIVVPLIFLLFDSLGSVGIRKGPRTIPTAIPTPSPLPTLPPGVPEVSVIRSSPVQDGQQYLPTQPVELTFSNSIDPSRVKIEVIPKTEIEVRAGTIGSSIVIMPARTWATGDTSIIVRPSEFSTGRLIRPYTYLLRTGLPPTPAYEKENY